MVGESGKSHTGTMHYYYKCGNAKRKKGCDKKAVRKDWIERVVVRLTMERVLNEEKITRIIDALLVMQEREDVTIPALRRQLAETEKGIENMLNAIQQGIFTASTKQRLEELEKQKEELSLSMTTAELQKPKLTREYMEHWFSQFRYGDPNDREFQKRLIDTFVNAIFVYDDKLVLTYNYQHGTQTITLNEVEDFLGSDLVGLSPPMKKPRHLSWLFHWVPRRTAALHPPVIEMLGGSEFRLRQGFACGKTLVTRHSARPPEGGIYSVAMLQTKRHDVCRGVLFGLRPGGAGLSTI